MKDQAGVEITVGCRVAEADFAFGDGGVESLTVLPLVGHCPHDEAPRAVNARLLEILKAQGA